MATTQALLIEHTIKDMKKAMSRGDDASDSDSSIHKRTNRGNKLKRKAKHVREGRLAQADGPSVYKKRILYNDYPRYIISRNPPRVDQDGDVVDSENDNSDLDTTDAEDDPYRDVRVESILMPLASAADLDKHPSLSFPYTNQILEQMVQNVQDMVQREQAALWRLKAVHTQFCGDDPYAPVGNFQEAEKMEDFEEQQEIASAVESVVTETNKSAQPLANWDTMTNVRLMAGLENAADTGSRERAGGRQEERQNVDDGRTGAQEEVEPLGSRVEPDTADSVKASARPSGTASTSGDAENDQAGAQGSLTALVDTADAQREGEDGEHTRGTPTAKERLGEVDVDKFENTANTAANQPDNDDPVEPKQELSTTTSRSTQPPNPDRPDQTKPPDDPQAILNGDNISVQDHALSDGAAPDGASDPSDGPRRMATRAHTRATAPDAIGQPTPPLSATDSPLLYTTQIHPFFLPPPDALPNPSGGLHPRLADEARRYLSMYVQKQQEVTRQAEELLSGLRKALRLKNTVWDWCRSEGHVGELSDGEDWIDAEKWGLEPEELRKGEEVEDEDPAGMVVKKTRNRRGAQ